MDQKKVATTPATSKVTTFYIKDAKSNQIKLVHATPGKPFRVKNIDNKQQVCYVAAPNLETLAKGASVVDTRRELGNLQIQTNLPQGASHVVAVPTVNTGVAPKMSPYKEASILPKPVHLGSSPMILSPPQQRVVSIATSPRTPQAQPSPAAPAADQWPSKRATDYREIDYTDSNSGKRSRKGEKGKGLRHFSMKVCEKVQKKGVTSYNEVADELVAEFSDPQRSMSPTDQAYDQKNIRRRVYDALNVLMAMNIISKEKKEIRWLGLPTNSAQECGRLEHDRHKRAERIRLKTQQLHELILQQIAYKSLVQRNKQNEKANGSPSPNSTIHLPFIVINTSKKTIIDCSISNDKMEYLFNFDNTFEIHDDIEVLKRMGMTFALEKGQCSTEDVASAKGMVPKALEEYVAQMSKGAARLGDSSIVPGPSGLQAYGGGSSSSGIAGSSEASDDLDQLIGAAIASSVSATGVGGVRRLSRQSSVASGSDRVPSSRHDAPTTSDEEDDFSGSDSDDDPALMEEEEDDLTDAVAMAE